MIEIYNISKSFGDKKVLTNISGTFEKGKPNLIIGASGTGKSVLLKCIVELITPDEGKVFLMVEILRMHRARKRLRLEEK